jgi:anti-sigma factor RsiW
MNTRVTCADGVDLLMEYLEDTLAPADREALEAHVSACPRCVAFIESYRQTPGILRAATAAALPEELGRSLHRFLASRRQSRS